MLKSELNSKFEVEKSLEYLEDEEFVKYGTKEEKDEPLDEAEGKETVTVLTTEVKELL